MTRGGLPVSVLNLNGFRLDMRDLSQEGARSAHEIAGPDYLIPSPRGYSLVVTDPIRYQNLRDIQEAWYRDAVVPVAVVPGATVLERLPY